MDGLKPLFGGFLKIPLPLELSGNFCSHKCTYCFANLNSPTRTLDTKSVLNLLANFEKRKSLEALLLQLGCPVMISNHVDPFAASNYRQLVPIMKMMSELNIEYSVQTKGGKGWEEILEVLKPSVWYISISHDQEATRKQIEPAAPPLEHRYELIEAVVSKGHTVIVGFNPCVEEWVLDPQLFLEKLKSLGVYAVWMEPIHINSKQKAAMPIRDREALGDKLLKECLSRKGADLSFFLKCREIAQDIGLEVMSVGQGITSNAFKPYYDLYEAAFPTTQELVNHCYLENIEFLTYRNYVDFFTPLLPEFAHPASYHYIDSQVRMCPEKALGFKAPKNPSYDLVLKSVLRNDIHHCHPVNNHAFAYAVDNDEKRWLDDDGCPILCFNEGGWTHEMIIYDKHPFS